MSTCIDPMDLPPNIKVPDIVSIKDVIGTEVNTLADGVYVVTLSNGEHIMVVN